MVRTFVFSSTATGALKRHSTRSPAVRDRNDSRCRSAIRARHTPTVREDGTSTRMRRTLWLLDPVPADRDVRYLAITLQGNVPARAPRTQKVCGIPVGDRFLETELIWSSAVRTSVPACISIGNCDDGSCVTFDENVTGDSSHTHLFL
jgi:hypothetical protein